MNYLTNCFYINLEKRKDRRVHVTAQLEQMNIPGERFNAVETKDGAIGCTMSHIKCLELAKERGYEHVFICEDDITFLNPELLKTNLQRFIDTNVTWDVIIIGGNNCPPYQTIDDFAIKVGNCQTTTGYIVNKHYLDTLISNFRESAANLIKNPANKQMYALDIYWKRLQQMHNWFMITPITVIQVQSYSDIENRVTDYKGLMLDLEKKWIFEREHMRHF